MWIRRVKAQVRQASKADQKVTYWSHYLAGIQPSPASGTQGHSLASTAGTAHTRAPRAAAPTEMRDRRRLKHYLPSFNEVFIQFFIITHTYKFVLDLLVNIMCYCICNTDYCHSTEKHSPVFYTEHRSFSCTAYRWPWVDRRHRWSHMSTVKMRRE